ncbi:polysaccharide deacetylase family protein [uncultured Devosia sp.]|uniref:polysaccharide deacetylase family protein n=1 Tax=uncultured Devosia sp. TaxID=211434 RepID=UPI0035CBE156
MMLGLGIALSPALAPSSRLAPYQARPALPAGTIITQWQSGHGWTKGGTGGSGGDDTAVFAEGIQSYRLSTPANATPIYATKAGLSGINLTTHFLRYRLRVSEWAKLGALYLAITDGAGVFSQTTIGSGLTGIASDGEWVYLHLTGGDFKQPQASNYLTVDPSNVTAFRLSAQGTASNAPFDLNIQHLELLPYAGPGHVIFAFDDGWKSTYAKALPILSARNFPALVYPICDAISAGIGSGSYMGRDELRSLQDTYGWDIGCHAATLAHHNSANGLLDLSLADFRQECIDMKRWNRRYGFTADHFAWPLGKQDRDRRLIAAQYFSSIRVFRNQLNSFETDTYPFADPTYLRQMAVTGGSSPSSAAAVTAAIDQAMTAKKTAILTFHNIVDGGGSNGIDYPTASFQAIVNHVAAQGYKVTTLTEVFADGLS